MSKKIPLATAEWLEEHCPSFTLPPRVAALFAVQQERLKQRREQDPVEPNDNGEGEPS